MKRIFLTKAESVRLRGFIKELKKTRSTKDAVIVAFARVTGKLFSECRITIIKTGD